MSVFLENWLLIYGLLKFCKLLVCLHKANKLNDPIANMTDIETARSNAAAIKQISGGMSATPPINTIPASRIPMPAGVNVKNKRKVENTPLNMQV